MFLSPNEKERLRDHIRETEEKTSGEIVTVIAEQSDGYRYIPLLWSTLCALAVPGIYYLYQALTGNGWIYPGENTSALALLYQIQVLVFFGLALLFSLTPLGLKLIPTSVKRERAARQAAEQFYAQGIHTTEARAGILVFVSVAERYVEIRVDSAIADRISNAEWQDTIDAFVGALKRGEIAAGFELTLTKCRDVLWEHFPASNNADELPNHLIEI
ncbi:MAG: TPM domain-containing protein [Gammaproteobacteria bacterium]|nr:TPM domain-containing protein [Gammaproteobacteria bacterium]